MNSKIVMCIQKSEFASKNCNMHPNIVIFIQKSSFHSKIGSCIQKSEFASESRNVHAKKRNLHPKVRMCIQKSEFAFKNWNVHLKIGICIQKLDFASLTWFLCRKFDFPTKVLTLHSKIVLKLSKRLPKEFHIFLISDSKESRTSR